MAKPKNIFVYGQFLKVFIPISLVLVLSVAGLIKLEEKILQEKISHQEKALVSREMAVFTASLNAHIYDTIFLSKLVENYMLDYKTEKALLDRVSRNFLSFSKTNNLYDQVRYLDSNGMERVRINFTLKGYKTVPESHLQYKNDRKYFINGMNPEYELYLSKFDLNVENRQVEIPYKPVLRITSPVRNKKAEKIGLVVLNLKGQQILDRLKRVSQFSDGEVYLVNSDGYWLVGPNHVVEWGFMFEEGKSKTIDALFPEEWKRIVSANEGQFVTPKGLITFIEICNLDCEPGGLQKYGGIAEENWIIVSIVSPQRFLLHWKRQAYGISIAITVVLGVIIWFWAKAGAERKKASLELV